MRRSMLRLSQMAIDLTVLAMVFAIAFMMRFDWRPPTDMVGRLALTIPYIVVGEYLVLWIFGIPKFSWRYIGLHEMWRILAATVVANVLLLWTRIGLAELVTDYAYLRHGVIPLGVIASNFVLMFLGIVGVRVARRIVGEQMESRRRLSSGAKQTSKVPTMLVGAGQGGLLMAKEIASRPDLGLQPVGFLDDDLNKKGTVVHGISVLGTTEELPALSERHGADQVLITMASAPGATIRRIARLAEEANLPVKIIPGLYQIAQGRVALSRIRPVAIEDLLRREPVELDNDAIRHDVHDRTVLVTGAGGSIGSELCRQLASHRPARLLLAERAENSLFHIHRELRSRHPNQTIVPLIADVTDKTRMAAIFEAENVDAVFHAAAHKHVPMMEWNPGEAVKNNVFGTRAVADLAHEYGAKKFVMVSTDKAVNPTSIMGATKRVAEMYVQSLAARSDTRFVTVRFGNVLGSAGSVIPIFKEQIANGGPVTVTHPEMTRYFMTIPEACQLVLQACTMGRGGEIFILDMGEPVKIVDIARDLVRLSRPRARIGTSNIVFTGIRPGEKLFEELSVDSENADKTKHPKIFVGKRAAPAADELEELLDGLSRYIESFDRDAVADAIRRCVPEFRDPEPQSEPPKEAIATSPVEPKDDRAAAFAPGKLATTGAD